MTTFWYYGPLPPDSALFRGRQTELDQIRQCCQGELRSYLIIFGGRQTGKTSLLCRLRDFLGESYLVCHLDLQSLTGATPEYVYGYIGGEVSRLAAGVPVPAAVLTSLELTQFIQQVANQMPHDKLVLLFEELGCLPSATAIALANLLRGWFTSRFHSGRQAFGRVMVILAGNVELYRLAAVEVSPLYNISQAIYLPDLPPAEAVDLINSGLAQLDLPPALRSQLGQAVFDLVTGHPYLTQRLGGELEALRRETVFDIDMAAVSHIANSIQEDDPLVRHLHHALTELKLWPAIGELLEGTIKYSRHDEEMALLELLGLATGRAGYWVIRNKLFEQILRGWQGYLPQPRPDSNSKNNQDKVEVKMVTNYDISVVRELLLNAFTTEELKRFCFDDRRFRPVYDEFSSGMGKADVIDRILEFSQNNSLMAELLQMVKQRNPRQFANFETRLYLAEEKAVSTPPPPSPKVPEPLTVPTSSSVSSTATPWTGLRLQISDLAGLEFNLRAYDTPMGETKAKSQLPYDATGLIAVLKALHAGSYDPATFSEMQQQTLQELGLLHGSRFTVNMLDRIGQGLYQALFPGKAGSALDMALNQARGKRGVVGLQLRFDAEAVGLARYPWELLHDGHRPLLSSGAVELTRYISYDEAPTPLNAVPPWRLLYITARPSNLNALPADQERQTVLDSLQSLTDGFRLTIDPLTPPTYDKLLDTLSAADYHIIHFDGHGVFAKKCPNCKAMNQAHLTECADCQDSLTDVQPGGFLAFEDEDGRVDYVDTSALENALFGNQVRLALISACVSATVRGETLFSGVGPGLIRAGTPAVVAMQLPIPVKSAINFAKGFYTTLTQGESISRAVAEGRRRLFRDGAYFIPTLYLRSSDDEGKLFIA